MKTLLFIGIAVVLFLVVISTIKRAKRERFRKTNRAAQFSGSPKKEDKGFFSSLLRAFSRSPEAIGERGEREVSYYLSDLPYQDYMVFNDLLLVNGNYTTQIDHLILSRFGIFVIETKNYHGKIYGNDNMEYWKQYLPAVGYRRTGRTQEHQLRNPVWQNEGHIKTLRRLVFGNDVPIIGILVFPSSADLCGTVNYPVLRMRNVARFILSCRNDVLTAEQVKDFCSRILEVTSTSGEDRAVHLDNVYRNQARRDAAVANGKCPRCGADLIVRNSRYGRFYGCSRYPNCNYIYHES